MCCVCCPESTKQCASSFLGVFAVLAVDDVGLCGWNGENNAFCNIHCLDHIILKAKTINQLSLPFVDFINHRLSVNQITHPVNLSYLLRNNLETPLHTTLFPPFRRPKYGIASLMRIERDRNYLIGRLKSVPILVTVFDCIVDFVRIFAILPHYQLHSSLLLPHEQKSSLSAVH